MWRGRNKIFEDKVEANALGFIDRPTIRGYENKHFTIPPPLLAAIQGVYAQHREDQDEPLWLELYRSSGELSFAPWEALLFDATSGPILRIPNFVVPPRFLDGDLLRLAICASSPRAKTPFEVAPYVADLVRNVQNCGVARTEIQIFADRRAYEGLAAMLHHTAPHTIDLHDADAAGQFGVGDTGSPLDDCPDVRSPWLRWMLSELSDAPIDAVHFACPGYFSDSRGALALARSPNVNDDRSWSHFVGASEIATFLNHAGALSLGLSAPMDSAANLGLRLLMDQVAQLRPGPVFLQDDWTTDSPTGRAYGFLFAPDHRPAIRARSLALYVHPKYLERFDQPQMWFASARDDAAQRSFALESSDEIAEYVEHGSRQSSASNEREPRWKRTMRLEVDQALKRISGADALAENADAVQEGASRAMALINSVLAGKDPS
jgi:hypothetical protein